MPKGSGIALGIAIGVAMYRSIKSDLEGQSVREVEWQNDALETARTAHQDIERTFTQLSGPDLRVVD